MGSHRAENAGVSQTWASHPLNHTFSLEEPKGLPVLHPDPRTGAPTGTGTHQARHQPFPHRVSAAVLGSS